MEISLNVPDHGQISGSWNNEGEWELEKRLKFLGQSLHIKLHTQSDSAKEHIPLEPDEYFLEQLKILLDHNDSLEGIVEDHVIAHYSWVREKWGAHQFSPKLPDKLPKGSSHFYFNYITVYPPRRGKRSLVLSGSCDWDEEHGLDLHIEGNKVGPV